MSKRSKIHLNLVGPTDGTIRIDVAYADGRDPHYLPSATRIDTTHPLWPVVVAAVRAAPEVERDRDGLYWNDKDHVRVALEAAQAAAKKVRA